MQQQNLAGSQLLLNNMSKLEEKKNKKNQTTIKFTDSAQ